jgi:hexosaminidase
MPAELARYDALGWPHATHLTGDPPPPAAPLVRDSHELTLCSNAIALSIEGPAPLTGKRPVYLHDIMNPCWIWPKADLTGVTVLMLAAGQLPFNFQIGADLAKVAKRPAATPDGEFEVHLDTCDGAKIATVAMPHAAPDTGLVTVHGALAPQTGTHDLCLMFTTPTLEPYWALHTVELVH